MIIVFLNVILNKLIFCMYL
uniref:Uncharacterized protein n=1 Tax=Heterorhabditis bacteriophora TaxID=37862 RepID=A0A1I7WQS0_HETBA